jgi:hypothetical protein
MSRAMNRLSATQVKHAKATKKIQKLTDGGGLLLCIKPELDPDGNVIGTRRYWQLRYKVAKENGTKKDTTTGLGTYPEVSLQEARELRRKIRKDLKDGITPQQRKRLIELEQIEVERAKSHTFRAVAQQWYDAVNGNWRNPKHRKMVWDSLDNHVFPYLGKTPVMDIRTYDVRQVIERILKRGTWETGQRVYQRMSAVFDEAVERELIDYNPAQVLRNRLFKMRPEKTKNQHFPALSPDEFPEFIQSFNKARTTMNPAISLAVELQMLTITRPVELRGARWEEIDFDNSVWNIPESRMKMQKPHQVPLSRQAITALHCLHPLPKHSHDPKENEIG